MNLPETIPEALLATAARQAGKYTFHLEEGAVRLSCAELAERADAGARRLAALGVRPGDAVGVLGPNRPEWVVWAFAIWLAGAVLAPLQVPLRIRDRAAFREQIRSLIEAGGCRRVLADPALASLLPEGVAVDWEGAGEASTAAPEVPTADSAAVIQFTSGSTAAPRGALLSHRAVIAQMEILAAIATDGDACRTSSSWTPFFHDLGLFLNVLPAAVWGLSSHHLPTERFARDPAEWLRLTARSRASLTVAPPSAFGNALRALERRGEHVDLGALDAVRFAAEGVDPAVLRRVAEAAPRLSLRPEALGSSYGMAEAVLAATYSTPGSGVRLDRVSLEALATEGIATPAGPERSRVLVGCGPPRMELRIAGPGGEALPDRQVGEILLRGPSLMSRYIGADAPDPFTGGWLHSGDLGYMAEGELYVTGRVKDVMIAMGHNYYPEDFEWAAARVDGVRPGRCVAFNLPGTEAVAVLVEAAGNGSSDSLARAVGGAIRDAVGVRPAEVVVLPPGTVEKTTSGKLRRAAMRELYVSGALEEVVA